MVNTDETPNPAEKFYYTALSILVGSALLFLGANWIDYWTNPSKYDSKAKEIREIELENKSIYKINSIEDKIE